MKMKMQTKTIYTIKTILSLMMSVQPGYAWKANQHAQGMVVKLYKSNLVMKTPRILQCDAVVCKMQNAKKKYPVCPPGLCMSSKPGCINRGGKIVQVKPRDPKSDDEKMRCCGEENVKCHRPNASGTHKNAQPGYAWKANQHAQGMVVKLYKSNLVMKTRRILQCDVVVYKNAKCHMYQKKGKTLLQSSWYQNTKALSS